MTGLEAFIGYAVESIATKVVESIFVSGGGFAKVSFRFFRNRILRDVTTASRKYAQNHENRHGIIKVLSMTDPIPLNSVYVDTNILSQSKGIASEKEDFSKNERKTNPIQEPSNSIKIANKKQYLMVLGNPGYGKTTFLRKVGLEALKGIKGSFSHRCIPV